MNVKRRRLGLVLAIAAVLILIAGLNPYTLPWAARWLDVGGPPQKADAVVLLNGGLNTRPFVAAALVHGGWAAKILLSTVAAGASQVSGAIPPFAEITSNVLDYGGVPRERVVLLDSHAETTFDEAQAVARYLAVHPAKRLMIVTDGPHTRRARWIFQRVLADRQVEIKIVSAPTEEFDDGNWWRSEAGFQFILSEYFKLAFYGLRYGWLGCELSIIAALMIILGAWFLRRRKLSRSETV